MNVEVSALVGFAVADGVTTAVTPFAIAAARRAHFLDHPREYRRHAVATPFLGGTAVIAGFVVAAVAVGGLSGKHVLLACALGMWVIGTIDDRFAVPPFWRLLAEAGAAVGLFATDLGWQTNAGGIADLALTVLWVVGIVNAFNLMDNLDGACGTVGAVCAAGIGTLAAIHHQTALAGLGFALAGGCAGFLPFNLAGPARIFLGDGGSMPIGFLVAALSMTLSRTLGHADGRVLVVAMLAGLPILDTALVSFSRTRRGVPLVTGGRDHLTHRLLLALPSPRLVAATLAGLQAALCALAIVGDQNGTATLVALAFAAIASGSTAVVLLDADRWRPAGIAIAPKRRSVAAAREAEPSAFPVESTPIGADPR